MIDAKKFPGSRGRDDLAGLQQNDARSEEQRLAQIVRDKNDGFAETSSQGAEFTLQFRARDRVQRAKRLIHQQNRRVGRKSARHANALALTAGEFAWQAAAEFLRIEADEL
jgi:hypothetical protein